MRFICDLHLHSRFAQGCSKDITVKNLEKWAKIKGIDLLGTGDFTHPGWIKELKEELREEHDGIYYTRTGQAFMLTTEISLIYTQGKGRRIHLVIFAPSFSVVERITAYLLTHGRVDYDGRPIFNIPAWQFVKDLRTIDERIEIIPAHAWTPWFSVYGSKSGFDTLQECFKNQTKHIHAIETGISSDIEMNDRLEQHKGIRFVSFSDAHSYWPWRLGREATLFDLEQLTYDGIIRAIRTGEGFWGTIEVEPSYGKYHADGHRKCDVSMTPEESKEHHGICPVCKQQLTIGVWTRVEELADKKEGAASQRYLKLLPLHEILSLVLGRGLNTKSVWNEYWRVLKAGKHEFDILMNLSEEALTAVTSPDIAKAIVAVRKGRVEFTPGYDGVYGVPRFLGQELRTKAKSYMGEAGATALMKKPKRQKGLNEFFG